LKELLIYKGRKKQEERKPFEEPYRGGVLRGRATFASLAVYPKAVAEMWSPPPTNQRAIIGVDGKRQLSANEPQGKARGNPFIVSR